MNDLISRKDVLEKLKYEMKYGAIIDQCGLEIAYDIVEVLPPAEPEQKWIPVSEALPEEKQNVLVTTIDGEIKVSMLTDFTYWRNIGRGEVLAWMSLPEAYRGEE